MMWQVHSSCLKKALLWHTHVSRFHLSACLGIVRASKEIRHTFFSYFNKLDHVHVPSSSIVAKKGEGSYFVNAGMNQFKPIFLGTASPDTELSKYKRVYNSQKCIRVGGKHNDLEEVGQDCVHHTFFEMLGSWSFGDYFKEKACEYAWRLLTQGYGIPSESLCVTYFGGSEEYELAADEETRDIWLRLGVPRDRVLPFGMRDNFWEMGSTGPCGPCTEIHYSHMGPLDFVHLVNSGGHEVVELWNLVFIQYDRQQDGQLIWLPRQHVDTGMGLERLTAILQGKRSNYDTDLFQPIISMIEKACKAPPYQGRIGWHDSGAVDTAYRMVADHARMYTVAIGDGLLPGPYDGEYYLRHILHRCIRQAHNSLDAPVGLLGNLVDVVVDSLGDAFPELSAKSTMIKEVVDMSESKYLEKWREGHRIIRKVISKLPPKENHLPVDKVLALRDGTYGVRLPIHLIYDLVEDYSLLIDHEALDSRLKESQVVPPEVTVVQQTVLNAAVLALLNQRNIPATDDSQKYSAHKTQTGYAVPKLTCQVKALVSDGCLVDSVEAGKECGVVLDRTCFYSEQGGQVCDVGWLTGDNMSTSVHITDVKRYGQYVLHVGQVEGAPLSVGHQVQLEVDSDHRTLCMFNHTATHLLHNALRKVLGSTVRQNGSFVGPNKLSFECTSIVDMTSHMLQEIEDIVQNLIDMDVPVYRTELPLEQAKQLPGVVYQQDEVYPTSVWVLSVGMPVADIMHSRSAVGLSVELCGGTHVASTGELKAFSITSAVGLTLGSKKITAVTGDLAVKTRSLGAELVDQCTSLADDVKKGVNCDTWTERDRTIGLALANDLLPKLLRDHVQTSLAKLGEQVGAVSNKAASQDTQQQLESLLRSNSTHPVVATLNFSKVKSVLKAIDNMSPRQPFMVFSTKKNTLTGVCHVPMEWCEQGLTVEQWSRYVQKLLDKGGKCGPPKGSVSSSQVYVLAGQMPKDLDSLMDQALEYAQRYR